MVPLRSQSTPQPSHIFSSTSKCFMCVLQGAVIPWQASMFFQRSKGLAQVARKRRHSVRRTLSAPSAQSQRLFVSLRSSFSPRERFRFHPCTSLPPSPNGAVPRSSRLISPPLPDMGIEGLAVIALDTFRVNVKLCFESAGCMHAGLSHQANYPAPRHSTPDD